MLKPFVLVVSAVKEKRTNGALAQHMLLAFI